MMRTPIIVLLRAGGPGRCQGEWESRPGPSGVAWGGRAEGLKETVTEGVRALKAGGADVVLMDLQYAPIVLAASNHRVMQAIIAEVARQERVGLFSRFALMRRTVWCFSDIWNATSCSTDSHARTFSSRLRSAKAGGST